MAYLDESALQQMGFASLGRNVKISDKASVYEPERMLIGDNCRIDDFCVVSGKVSMGRNVHIAPGCLVAGGRPGISFGDFSGLAYHVKVFAQSDDYSGQSLTNPTVPAAFKREIEIPIKIGRHAIVGAGSVIAPGADVGEGTAVGALALVLRPTSSWSIYAGIPAKKIKDRLHNLLDLEAIYLSDERRN